MHLLTEARERIARNQRGRVPSCQTPYELNGGRDRCKYSDTADCLAERQRRCGLAIDGFIEQVAQIDRTVEPREAARAAKVVEFKKRVFDNRRAGIAECQTWSELSVMAAR